MKSWKTTTFGVAGIVSAISSAVMALTDTDPATNPDWLLVVTAITTGLGLILSKDFNVSGTTKPVEPAK